MTSHYHYLNYKNNSQYPYTTKNKVVVDKDRVDFIYQFAKDSNARAKAYNNENAWSIEDTCSNIIGPPNKFPNYGDFSETLVVKLNISISPWQKEPDYRGTTFQCLYCNKPHDESTIHLNYIDLEFHEAVYPIRVSIYEVYNTGSVTQILAQDSDKYWFELWSHEGPKNDLSVPGHRSRIFSPSLQFCDFKTKILRLLFTPNYIADINWSTHLDAVELIGTSKLILPKNSKESLTELLRSIEDKWWAANFWNIGNLAPKMDEIAHLDILNLQKKFLEYCIICNSDIDKSDHKSKLVMHKQVHHSNYAYYIKDIEFYWNESNEQPRSSFSALPDEIILKILKDLDIRSLCRISQVNKRLNNLTWDRFLITSLNLRNVRYNMHSICIDNIISNYLAPRCESLQQLDLTSSNDISVSYFNDFLNICGKHLTHIRLRECKFFDNSVLLQISKICKNLKVLDLSYCIHANVITDEGFLYLENLEFLENLNLRRTFNITSETLCKILKKNRRMRDLNLGGLYRLLDTVAIQLRNSCPDLEVIDLRGNNITSLGIDALAECKNLRKLNISWMNPDGYEPYDSCTIDKRSLRRLFSSCLLLEEVHLKYLNDDFLEELTLCKNLKQVHLNMPVNASMNLHSSKFAILEQCPKLHTIYVHDWGKIRDIYAKDGGSHFVAQSEEYPHLPICELDYGTYGLL